jgi:predicted Abi (CAAX) family protease
MNLSSETVNLPLYLHHIVTVYRINYSLQYSTQYVKKTLTFYRPVFATTVTLIFVCRTVTYLFTVSIWGTKRSEIANVSVIIILKSYEHLC